MIETAANDHVDKLERLKNGETKPLGTIDSGGSATAASKSVDLDNVKTMPRRVMGKKLEKDVDKDIEILINEPPEFPIKSFLNAFTDSFKSDKLSVDETKIDIPE